MTHNNSTYKNLYTKHIHTLTPEQFPERLREMPDPPKQLHICGTLPEEPILKLTVVGSRTPTPYGISIVDAIIEALAPYHVVIISGLARGIDGATHRKALVEKIPCIGFPGSGLDPEFLYPKRHRQLSGQIVDAGGAMVSQFDPAQPAQKWTFPVRNRLMAAYADAVIVIEAREKSGSLVTAHAALEYGTDVYAVPGSIHSEQSAGCNFLIKEGATPIISTQSLIEDLGLAPLSANAHSRDISKLRDLSPIQQRIIEVLSTAQQISELARHVDLQPHELSMHLTQLEIKGLITEHMGMVYRK